MKINVLDCTLRDGGYLNDWEFGQNSILSIFRKLVKANLEAIEVGFLDDRRPYDKNRAIYPNTESICDFYKNESKNNTFITAMTTGLLDDGHCSIDNFAEHKDNDFIDGIRVPFKKHRIKEAVDFCYMLKDKGYKVFVNPTSITTYSDKEMLDLIDMVNNLEPYSMALVDTYGLLHKERLLKYFYLLDTNLKPSISIAHHAHNNFQLAFSNSCELLEVKTNRNIFIDSALYGMGKSAGNCNTELLTRYLNEFYNKSYDVSEILNAIELYILKYLKSCTWGYNLSYFLSASNKCHPNYVKFLEEKNMLGTKDINYILSQVSPAHALTFDKEHIQKLYTQYQNRNHADNRTYGDLKDKLSAKEVVLIGPGSSIKQEYDKIKSYIDDKNAVTISVNHLCNLFDTDYVFISNAKRYSHFMGIYKKADLKTKTIITNNIEKSYDADYVVNYSDLTDETSPIGDTAIFLLMKLLTESKVKKVYLAGFDGFSGFKPNYYDTDLQFYNQDVSNNVVDEIAKFLNSFDKEPKIEFLTKSDYETGV